MNRLLRATIFLGVTLGVTLAARGSTIVLHANQIVGTIGFTNTNPDVLAVLSSRGLDDLFIVAAGEVSGDAGSDARLQVRSSDHVATPYIVTVRTQEPPQAYWVWAGQEHHGTLARDTYFFEATLSPVVAREPAPDARLDLLDCAGVFHVRFVDAAGFPVAVDGADVEATSDPGITYGGLTAPGSTSRDIAVHGDSSLTYDIHVDVRYGLDPASDETWSRVTARASVACDGVTDVAVVVPPRPAGVRVTGNVDVVGLVENPVAGARDEARTAVHVHAPLSQSRYVSLPGPTSAGPWELSDVTAGSLTCRAVASVGRGTQHVDMWLGQREFSAADGATVDLGDMFVGAPAWMAGSIRLRGTPSWDGAPPALASLRGFVDRDGDTLPDARASDYGTVVTAGGTGDATGPAWGAWTVASFPWDVDADGNFLGVYRAPLATNGSQDQYGNQFLYLAFDAAGDAAMPWSHRDQASWVGLDSAPSHALGPGDELAWDVDLCMGELRYLIDSPDVAIVQPQLSGQGFFETTAEDGTITSWLTQAAWSRGVPGTLEPPAAEARVSIEVPAGDHGIDAWVNVPAADGSFTQVWLGNRAERVGCAQVILPDDGVQLTVLPLPACTHGVEHVTGTAHADAGLDSIAWSLDGGAETVLCSACGVDDAFDFDVVVDPGPHVLRVRATAATGATTSVTGFLRGPRELSAPGTEPLLVRRASGSLELTWESGTRGPFTVSQGSIAALHDGRVYDHARVEPCSSSSAVATIAMPAVDSYFLVSATCGGEEGPLGADSSGTQRPASTAGACP